MSGERSFGAMNITAVYKIDTTAKPPKLVRQGDLEVLPPSYKPGTKLSTKQVTLRTLLRNRLGEMLQPEIIAQPRAFGPDEDNKHTLQLKDLRGQDGWLSLGWDLDASEKR